jgi:hypothetical protein|tara:strand:+ start:849 stop:1247 length:399 start_codon:yes stop_codon:yes gene_type:complete
MYEVTTQELMIFVVLGFTLGVFVSFYLTRLLEVVHTWHIVDETVTQLLLMLAKISEDVHFLQELKRTHLVHSNTSLEAIRAFEKVDHAALTNWKESVILTIVNGSPRRFRSLIPFTNWDEAMRHLTSALKKD